MRITPFSQILITIGVLIVVLALVYLFIITPVLEEVDSGTNRLIGQRKQILAFERSDQELEKLSQEVRQLRELEPFLNRVFISKDTTLDFIVALEALGKRVGVTYEINIEGQPLSGRRVETSQQTFQVNLQGSFLQVARFIEGVENMAYFARVNRAQFSRRDDSGNIVASLNISAFSQ
ncbi:hypothetical protein C4553_02040 [Candidatus Parcubacteria bacterium]|nr:MAG: hypothetical protein C4553_02040 [Candidatus Parcubacteria bacterium]